MGLLKKSVKPIQMLAIFKASSLDPLYVDISPSYILGKPNMTWQ